VKDTSRPRRQDERLAAIAHYNDTVADRYGLRRLPILDYLEIDWTLENETLGFPDGLACLVARHAQRTTASVTLGHVGHTGREVEELAFLPAADELSPSLTGGLGYAILFNPTGGLDVFDAAMAWIWEAVRSQRESHVAGLTVRRIEDPEVPRTPRAVATSPREAMNEPMAEQVAYVFDVSGETLKRWRRARRSGRMAPAGRPRKGVIRTA
jgi:hypothetical protein